MFLHDAAENLKKKNNIVYSSLGKPFRTDASFLMSHKSCLMTLPQFIFSEEADMTSAE